MAESPPRGTASDAAGAKPGSAESDPLFNPPGLKARRTVMGLAPAPHLGGEGAVLTDAEERKQRVLARIAAMDGAKEGATTGPPPAYSAPPPAYSAPPPAELDRPKFGTGTLLISSGIPPVNGGPMPRHTSSERQLPSASGWDFHEVRDPRADRARAPAARIPEVQTELIEPPPVTARMLAQQGAASMTMPLAPLAVRPMSYSQPPPRPSLVHLTDPRLVLVREPNSGRATSYYLLRDTLLSKSMPRVVAVSSATPGDGKTTCAVNLALALAEVSSTRVLLVDANYFAPELAQVFAVERLTPIVPPDGNGAWLAPFTIVEINPGLHVAAVPRAKGEPPPRFELQRFEAMLEQLVRVSYDYIILDTPALRATPGVVQLLGVADATLFAVRSGTTAMRDLRRAVDQLAGKKTLGVALIDADPQP